MFLDIVDCYLLVQIYSLRWKTDVLLLLEHCKDFGKTIVEPYRLWFAKCFLQF